MWSSDSDRDETVETATSTASPAQQPSTPPRCRRQRARRRAQRLRAKNLGTGEEEEEKETVEAEDVWRGLQRQKQQRERESWPRRASRPVVVAGEEGFPDAAASGESGGGMGRARSLTDDDLEELKGCVDLGFGFSYHEIPELCGTLPALELCYSMSQRFLLDEHQQQPSKAVEAAPPAVAPASPAQPVATNWKISSPGDNPDDVKARLKYWAQAVACTVRLCS